MLRTLFAPVALLAAIVVVSPFEPGAAADEVVQCDGVPATLVGDGSGAPLVGTANDDVIVTAGATQVDAGAGDDTVCLTGPSAGKGAQVSGGSGRDRLLSEARRADLGAARLVGDVGTWAFAGVESYELRASGPFIRVGGSRRADDITVVGCKVVLRGGAGADVLSVSRPRTSDQECPKVRGSIGGGAGADEITSSLARVAVWSGVGDDVVTLARGGMVSAGAGSDVMIGGPRRDLLLGGGGSDVADGGGGFDRCVAETVVRCEE